MPLQTNETHIGRNDVPAVYLDSGNEAAIHGRFHLSLADYPAQDGITDIVDDRREWERICRRPVFGMAYANGSYNDDVVRYLDILGIHYSRTVLSTHDFFIPRDWLRLPATCHHNDPALFELLERFIALNPRANYNHAPKLFYLWGHSYEFNNNNNWDVFERFCNRAAGQNDIWYATNGAIYDYTKAYEALQFTLEGDCVYNPSCIDIFMESGKTGYMIKAGETVYIN